MKIRPVGAELFRADGWADGGTDMTRLIVAFRNFANARGNYWRHVAYSKNKRMVMKMKMRNLGTKRRCLMVGRSGSMR
jgi:hypothetical protein